MTVQRIPQTKAMLSRLYGALYGKNKHSGLYGQPHKSISELSARKTWFLFEFLPILLGCEWNNIVQAREFSSTDSVHEWLLRNCEDIKDLEETAYTLIVENEYKTAKNIFSYVLLMEYEKLCLYARSLQKEDGAIIDISKMKGENTEVWAEKALQWAKEYGYIVPEALLHLADVQVQMDTLAQTDNLSMVARLQFLDVLICEYEREHMKTKADALPERMRLALHKKYPKEATQAGVAKPKKDSGNTSRDISLASAECMPRLQSIFKDRVPKLEL